LVPKTALLPPELTRRPFTVDEARAAGVSPSALKGRSWRRLGRGVYCWTELRADAWTTLATWQRLLPRNAVFTGPSAALIHGLDVQREIDVEVAVPRGTAMRSRAGLRVRHLSFAVQDLTTMRGLRTTTLHRTLLDLCVRWPAVEALVAIDMAIHIGLTNVAGLCEYAYSAKGASGVLRLRRLAENAEPAESPMETRLRWLLLNRGLPRPHAQVNLGDRAGRFLGRADLYYPAARLVVEFDGGNHRERLVSDDRRQNLLTSAGFRILRFTSADVHQHPEMVAMQVRAALGMK